MKMQKMKHEITEIAPNTWCLSEFRLVNAFLAEGKEKAALIDTGCGIGNLGETVKELTQKPVEIFLTHGHADHSGGIYTLPQSPVYMMKEDEKLFQEMPATNEMRRFYVKTRVPVRYPGEGNVEAITALIPFIITHFSWKGAETIWRKQGYILRGRSHHRRWTVSMTRSASG